MLNANIQRTAGTDLFALGQDRMQWLQKRQSVLAGNIANSDTPDYVARDVSPFETTLSEFDIQPLTTNSKHIGNSRNDAHTIETESQTSIDGNHIILDEQLEQIANVNDQQHMAANIYGKYMSMFQTVLGK